MGIVFLIFCIGFCIYFFKKRDKDRKFKLWELYPILILFGIFGYFYIYGKRNFNYFNKHDINSKIIRINNYENKSLQFYYNEDYCITTEETNNDTLSIGDSIVKKMDTAFFDVYRKDYFGTYVFYKRYDYKK